MDGIFVIFAVWRKLGFVQQGEGSNCVKTRKIGPEFGTDQESKVHAIMSSEASKGCQHWKSDTVHDHSKTGLFVEAFSTFCLMNFSFPLTAI